MIEIALHQLQFYAFHGCLPQERVVGSDYTVDVRLILPDATTAIEEDDLNGTVNYASVYEVVRKEMEQPSNLLEHVCGRINRHILKTFPLISVVTLTLTKVNPPIGAACLGASVTLTTKREDV